MRTDLDVLQNKPDLADWRKWLVDPIVPKGEEGDTRPLSVAFPAKMLARIDKIAKETHNNRSDTIRHLLRWSLDAYDKARDAERVGVDIDTAKKAG